MEKRKANIIFGKSGGNASRNSYNCKISIPKTWVDRMGVNIDNREVELAFDGDRITIQNKPVVNKWKVQEVAFFWMQMYKNHESIPFYNFKDNIIMGDELANLGFEMDCVKSYCDTFGEMRMPDIDELKHFLPEMNIQVLGNLIFSHWRNWTHWSDYSIMEETDFEWFVIAFSRLAELASEL